MSLKEKLSKMEYHVTQEAGTEPPFSGKYHDEKSEGIYQCVCCDDDLFSSKSNDIIIHPVPVPKSNILRGVSLFSSKLFIKSIINSVSGLGSRV